MGKVMLVTGASAGIGREVAILLAGVGHRVYAGARRVERMRDLGEQGITPVAMDVTEAGDNERVVREIIDGEGRIDVLVNNAGFGLYGPVERIPLDEARYQFEVNLFGLAHLTQLVLPHMRARGSGRIINTSSVVGRPSRRSGLGIRRRSTRWRGGRTASVSKPRRSTSRSSSSNRARSEPSSAT